MAHRVIFLVGGHPDPVVAAFLLQLEETRWGIRGHGVHADLQEQPTGPYFDSLEESQFVASRTSNHASMMT
ncbi:hypothetical protein KTU01_31300 [Kocuria turfanensis]|uniref:Uncharacterized protein n=1 Tax=Kocuria turfanensis TaxID=388357 RepID=A0A512IH68_9MICC|nr:hypothetical protein KTU01_31300 [Kocuria turfanensis]